MQSSRRKVSQKASLKKRLLLALPFVVLLIGACLALPHLLGASAANVNTVSQASPCSLPAVSAAEATSSRLPTSQAKAVPVAMVDSQPIMSTELDAAMAAAQNSNSGQLAGMAQGNQLRQQVLNSLIDNKLWLDVARKSGKMVTASTAHSYMQNMLTSIDQLPQSDPAYVKFQAYLCANGLNETSFMSDARILQGYQDGLSVGAMKADFKQTLPPAMLNDPNKVTAALTAQTTTLRQQSQVQILP